MYHYVPRTYTCIHSSLYHQLAYHSSQCYFVIFASLLVHVMPSLASLPFWEVLRLLFNLGVVVRGCGLMVWAVCYCLLLPCFVCVCCVIYSCVHVYMHIICCSSFPHHFLSSSNCLSMGVAVACLCSFCCYMYSVVCVCVYWRCVHVCTGGVCMCVWEVCACVYGRCVHVCMGGVCMCVREVCACVYGRCVHVCTGGVCMCVLEVSFHHSLVLFFAPSSSSVGEFHVWVWHNHRVSITIGCGSYST